MIAKSHRWQKTALAAAAAALFGLWGSNAAALSLGRITVLSALGEPLRAEIEIPEINAEEANSLKSVVASPEAFRAAGLEYNAAMTSVQATLQRRPDGRAYIRLRSDRAINEPFVDMILEARWASGRIVRDYTMLFDPPSLRQTAPAAPTPAQIPAQPFVNRAPAPGSVQPTPPGVTATRPTEPRRSPVNTTARPALAKAPGSDTGKVTVKSGDTAGKIAAATKPANVSLDQMLVALLRANPTAFIGDNINRVKAGSILNVPTEEQAGATAAGEATQIIVAQSKDFNDFRRKLASNAPSAQVAAADRKASGSVQGTVVDQKPATAAPDKLTLSKGSVQGQPAEDQLAKERSAKEAASRAAEIAKNISDLSKLGAASGAAAPGLAASAAPSIAASAAAKRSPTVPVPAEPGLADGLFENPLLPAGAIGLIALLAGFGFYRSRQRKNAAQVDSAFLESRLQPDSFFGASGGQSVDTSDSAATGSSMAYSPSQLDAVDDVDPVAEADVYLAYGRDLQAEEILNDALRTNPGRVAIHQKLLEIFAKRRDTNGFENIAALAFKLTSGNGSDWERICELGLSIDPTNTLYQPGGQPINPDSTPSSLAPLTVPTPLPDSADTHPSRPETFAAAEPVDLDLDLDFSLDEEPSSLINETTASPVDSELPDLDLDFGLATETMTPFAPPPAEPTPGTIEFSLPEPEFTKDELPRPSANNENFKLQAATSFGTTSPVPLASSVPEEPAGPDLGMLEFDLGSLSLDLGDAPEPEATTAPAVYEDPLATKLALAEEFRAIGDDDGARALIEEVISEASGDMKAKAQRALSNL